MFKLYNIYASQFLVNCVIAKSRSVSPALATIHGAQFPSLCSSSTCAARLTFSPTRATEYITFSGTCFTCPG